MSRWPSVDSNLCRLPERYKSFYRFPEIPHPTLTIIALSFSEPSWLATELHISLPAHCSCRTLEGKSVSPTAALLLGISHNCWSLVDNCMDRCRIQTHRNNSTYIGYCPLNGFWGHNRSLQCSPNLICLVHMDCHFFSENQNCIITHKIQLVN